MLFNSYPFVFVFLPLALAGYEIAARFHRRFVVMWLVLVSLAFYAVWRPIFLVLLVVSILFNYALGQAIASQRGSARSRKWLLWFAIAANLSALCYFKYLFPTLNWLARILHSQARWSDILLPLGISFFTFTQIAYLVDLEEGSAEQPDFVSYCLFVTFFPHLIAGPILHNAEMMPQFQKARNYGLRADDLAVGFSWFIMGLFKKVMFADRFAVLANAAFAVPRHMALGPSWVGVLAYSLQLYFDFSGYSDMALGLARMFSIDFPLNFSSPYKASSIIDFWQRWHMTLTRYITMYIYNPVSLRMNRRRLARGQKISRKAFATPSGFLQMVAAPTLFTLLLAGIWHGAGAQFAIFGLLHGIYLSINHAWIIFRGTSEQTQRSRAHRAAQHVGSVLLTFGAVLVGQVFFRAGSVADALAILAGMAGLHGHISSGTAQVPTRAVLEIAAGFVIVWSFPNTQQILLKFKPALKVTKSDLSTRLLPIFWNPTVGWAGIMGVAFFLALIRLQDPSTFLYFQF